MVTALIVLTLAMLVECLVFNAASWQTLSASTDSDAAQNTLGSGLSRTADGLLKVTDPTQAYLEVGADGTSSYVRVDPSPTRRPAAGTAAKVSTTAHLRVDCDGRVGTMQSVSFTSQPSLYLRANAVSSIRVWIQEPQGTLLPLEAVRANVHVPLQIDWLRVLAMVLISALVLLWRPHSRLWTIRLDPSSRRQRLLFAAVAVPLGVVTLIAVIIQLRSPSALSFHASDGYVYDFDIYGHMADSLLNGHLWLDLPVPDALASAAHPYNTAVREELLAHGVSPIYWDYAWFDGHWYSYFGVLPALLLFAPYRLISSLWVPGGAMAPASAAVLLLTYGFLVFSTLLVIRLVHRVAPRASLASTSMAVVIMLVGSNIGYLGLRTNFYSVPFVAAMLLSTLGVWLWLRAGDGGHHRHGVWQVEGAPALSLPLLAGGSTAIAATLACRPTFSLVALLGLPIFWPQISALFKRRKNRAASAQPPTGGGDRHRLIPTAASGSVVPALACVLIPAAVFIVAVGAYNALRFGSPLDFGIRYQLTVTDMTTYPLSLTNVAHTIGYYLGLPLRLTNRFPFLATSPTPLPQWGFTEPMIGGILVICPVLILSAATVFLRRHLRHGGGWRLLTTCCCLAVTLIVVDSVAGGLGWRYMADFGWLLALPAIGTSLVLLGETTDVQNTDLQSTDVQTTDVRISDAAALPMSSRERRRAMRLWCARALMLVLLLICLLIAVLSIFVLGRDDALVRNDPDLFYTVQSWFNAASW